MSYLDSDLLLGPVIGGLTSERVYLWARCKSPGTLHAWLGREADLRDAQLAGTSLPLTVETGFAGVVPIHDLDGDTRYHYALTLEDAPPEPEGGPYPTFTTFPPAGERRSFTFSFGSCFLPMDENAGAIFDAIEARRVKDDLRFIALLGDQIYADKHKHNGLGRVALNLEDYRAVYTHTWSHPPLRRLLANLPAFMTLDDHEVDDDWGWVDMSRTVTTIPIWDRALRLLGGRSREERQIPLERVQDALQAYWEHQGMHSPGFQLPPRLNQEGRYTLETTDPGSLAYTFTYGAAAFFVLDTRTMRVKGRGERTMLGNGQWQALEGWLMAVKDRYPIKFLVSSCAMLFNMWLDIPRDRWSGFPKERDRLLHFLAHKGIEGVHILTGDLHSAHSVQVDLYGPEGRDLPVWEFCSTPFEQKPNRLAKYTYKPLRSGPIKRQRLHFVESAHNFGVVRVGFPEGGEPQVRFEVYGRDGEMLNAVDARGV